MKATELMQGDLIYEGDNIVIKVECLCYHEIDGMMEECYSPIPLTPEILEKNGWWQDEIDGTYHSTMNVYGRKAPFSVFDGVTINYVHELQHALRLCGLEELANNFKV